VVVTDIAGRVQPAGLAELVERAARLPGWFAGDELLALGRAVVDRPPRGGEIVEVGCYQGQATSVLAALSEDRQPGSRVHVIDPFDGVVGGIGEGLWSTAQSQATFRRSIGELGLASSVQMWPGTTATAGFDRSISFLLINGLHDYGSVAADFRVLAPLFTARCTIAFHNYCDTWPGVRTFVDQLVRSGRWQWVSQVGALAVVAAVADPPPRPRGAQRRAFLTMVANESVFLPIWLRYYAQFAGPEDLYVIDHDSIDGSTSGPGFVRLPAHRRQTDWAWITQVVAGHQRRLLAEYDVVVYTDVDEIVLPDPEFGDLARYLDDFDADFVTCRGWEVLHDPTTEAAYDASRLVLDQRGWWYPNPAYSKPAVSSTPSPWTGGFHARTDGAVNDDPRLFLLHLHRMDFDLCRARHQQRVDRPWVAAQVRAGWGFQNRIVEPEPFHRWFFEDAGWPGVTLARQRIPDRWRGLV
jgi:Methyltransferase domain